MPVWAPEKEKGQEMPLTQHPIFLSTRLKGTEVQLPLKLQTDASEGNDVSFTEGSSASPPSTTTMESYGSPPEMTPTQSEFYQGE